MTEGMSFFDPPPLRWVGSKWQLADWIISTMPPHLLYCEPFAGSAAVFFRKPPSRIEVLNDLDNELVNFFDVLRNCPDDLIRAIDLTPYARAEYERSYVVEPELPVLERARRFYIRCWMAWGGTQKSGWRVQYEPGWGYSAPQQFNRLSGLIKGAARLKDAQIESAPAQDVLKRFDRPDALFYVDPPYVMTARSEGARRRYAHEMNDADHRDLAQVLHHMQGYVILSGYDSPLYRELYDGWRMLSKTTTTQGNSIAAEYLWLSPNVIDLNSLPLFAYAGGE